METNVSLGQREKTSQLRYGASLAAVAGISGLVYRRYFGSHAIFTKLKRDHRMVSMMLQSIQFMPRTQVKARKELFNKMKTALLAHAKSEEALIYPALRAKRASHVEALEAFAEHQIIHELINELSRLNAGKDEFDAKLRLLKEVIMHHVREEESTVFRLMKKEFTGKQLKNFDEKFVELEEHKMKRMH
jgi:hemerythrin superfamily protein